MIKNISETRKDYEYSYWLIRARGYDVYHDFPPFPVTAVEDCAVLSHDSRHSEFSGWINRQRRLIWKNGIYNRWPAREFPL